MELVFFLLSWCIPKKTSPKIIINNNINTENFLASSVIHKEIIKIILNVWHC